MSCSSGLHPVAHLNKARFTETLKKLDDIALAGLPVHFILPAQLHADGLHGHGSDDEIPSPARRFIQAVAVGLLTIYGEQLIVKAAEQYIPGPLNNSGTLNPYRHITITLSVELHFEIMIKCGCYHCQ